MRNMFLKTVQSFAIWLSTHILTFVVFILATRAGIYFEPVLCDQCGTTLLYAVLIGMVLSSPVIILLMPALYLVDNLQLIRMRMIFGFMVILILSAIVIVSFVAFFDPRREQPHLVLFLAPYAVMAEVSFFLVARKAIFSNGESEHLESETIDL